MLETKLFPDAEVIDPNTLPNSRWAEEAAIGSVMINPDMYADCAAIVTHDDFYIHRNKWIWEVFGILSENRQPIDVLMVSDELEKRGQLEEVGGAAYLTGLLNQVPNSMDAEKYAGIVAEMSTRRKTIEAANLLAAGAYNRKLEIAKTLDSASAHVLTLQTRAVKDTNVMTLGDALSVQYDRMQDIAENGKPQSIPTGFYDLDSILHGLHAQDLLIIATRPGKGKSALLQSIATNVAGKQKKAVGINSLEMTAIQTANRMMAMYAKLQANDLRDGILKDSDWPVFTNAFEQMSTWRVTIDDTPAITPERLYAKARRLRERGELDLLEVDYIQIMGVSEKFGYNKNRNREQEVSHMARTLKFIARDLDIPVIAAAQVSRAVDARADKKLVLSDLRESGSLEQEADIVIFIQPGKDDQPKAENQIVDIDVAKHRSGPLGSVQLLFESEHTGFHNLRRQDDRRNWWE